MIRRPPRSTRTDTLFPYTTLFRSTKAAGVPHALIPVALIVARADNGIIGRAGGLPWHLSGDLKFFKAQTLGKPVAMGRKTWQSIGKPLPGRPNLVIPRDAAFKAEGAEVVATLARSDERRVGTEGVSTCRSRWAPDH